MRKILGMTVALLIIFASETLAESPLQIEIFDINKGKVVKVVPTSEDTQKDVEIMLRQINGIYQQFQPIPNKGYMVKVPLEPAFLVENKWMQGYVREVIIIFPEYENPHLMVFNEENKSFFFTFNGSVDSFLESVDFIPKPRH